MFARERMMHVWICSTCCCIAVSARVYQSILQLRVAVSGFSAHLSAGDCTGLQSRPMQMDERTQHRFSAPRHVLQHCHSFLWPGHYITRLETAHALSTYHYILQSQPSLTSFVIVQTQTGNQNTMTWLLRIPWSGLVSCISSQMTHALGSEPAPDIDNEIKLISSMLMNVVYHNS